MAKERRVSALDRMVQQAIGAERTLGREDDPAREAYPSVWDWLSRIYLEGNHIKQPATITLRLGPEGVMATLTDRDLGCSIDVATANLADALKALEAALTGPSPPIRSWGKKEPSVRKRKAL